MPQSITPRPPLSLRRTSPVLDSRTITSVEPMPFLTLPVTAIVEPGRLRGALTPGQTLLAASAFLLAAGQPLAAQQPGAQTSAPIPANASPLTAQAQTGPLVLSGTVADPDAAEIPGATLTLTPPGAKGQAYSVTSKSDGTYSFRGVPAGVYSLTATMNGFATFVQQGVKIGGPALSINIKMAVQASNVVVQVSTQDNTVSVDPEKNAGGLTLSEKDLEAFSDDPDELSDELTALAGPASGPNGGQIYIDGFTGGQLPPKSSIREIRINQNPFSAQYDQPGFGRIEIFTKPGTDKFHGNFQLNGLDKGFNTGSPFLAGASEPGYHSVYTFDSLSGPLNKKASFTANGSYREIQNTAIVNPPAIYATSQTSGVPCAPGTSGCQLFQTSTNNGYTTAQLTPATRFDVGPRIDLALGEKNTATIRFQYVRNKQQDENIGGVNLYSTGYNSLTTETTLQVSDTQIFSSKLINETRFEYQRPSSTITPFSTTPSIAVQGAFSSGGDPQQTENDVQTHIEAQNYTSYALTKHFIRLGGRLRSTSDNNTTNSGSNGSFSYTSIANYQNNVINDFTITNVVKPTVQIDSVDLGVYAEDDWKIIPTLTFSYGLRYETQNYIGDHKDFAPRLAAAYGVTKKTVLRTGFGIFYDRFLPQSQLAVARNNGVNQQQFTLSSNNTNGATIPPGCTPANVSLCLQTNGGSSLQGSSTLTEQTVASNLRAPYRLQFNLGVDQQIFKNATLSVNYQHIRGVHQFLSDAINPTTASATQPLNYQYQSEGEFNQNQLILNANVRGFHGISLFGFYSLNFANSDTSGIGSFSSVPNNPKADYGRAGFDVRNRLFLGGSMNLPHLIVLSPFIVAQSGNPYNVTYGGDFFGDNQQNYRAVEVPAGTAVPTFATGATNVYYVKTIPGCGTFATPSTAKNPTPYGTTEAPINPCTGPALFTANLRVTKTWGFGPQTGPRPDRNQGAQGGPPGGGPPRGGGGGGRGGGGGGFGGNGASSGKRYNLTIGAQARNLFNVVDRNTPVGTLSSPSFGSSTQLAGNIFTTDSAVRVIQFQLGLQF